MPRVKGGYTTRRRRKAILKLAKGYYGSKHALYKTAHEQVMRSWAYAYRDRKQRKRDFRKLWITRINAACQLNDIKYSRFINGLSKAERICRSLRDCEKSIDEKDDEKTTERKRCRIEKTSKKFQIIGVRTYYFFGPLTF